MTGHYCQACDYPQLMTPEDGAVRCPACGAADSLAVIRPLFVVTGASGSGKTTILPEPPQPAAGWCAVFDVDWLIDPLGRAAGGAVDWTVFRDTWLHVAHGMAQKACRRSASIRNCVDAAWARRCKNTLCVNVVSPVAFRCDPRAR